MLFKSILGILIGLSTLFATTFTADASEKPDIEANYSNVGIRLSGKAVQGKTELRTVRKRAQRTNYIRSIRMVVPRCGAFGALRSVSDALGCEETERRATTGCPRGFVVRVDTRVPDQIQGWTAK